MNALKRKVDTAITTIRSFAHIAQRKGGYYLAFSGGKDSAVCKHLMDMAGVKYDAHYIVSSVDPPEVVQFIKDNHPDVNREIPKYADGSPATMWNLIPKQGMPPPRIARYCCRVLKEDKGDDRFAVTGVRWAESTNRAKNAGQVMVKNPDAQTIGMATDNFKATQRDGLVLINDNDEARRTLEQCTRRNKLTLNPIVDWTDNEVWEFIHSENIPYCQLYDEGYHRVGCLGCPMGSRKQRERQFLRWGKYKTLYMLAFENMLNERERKGKKPFVAGNTPEDVYRWWMEYDTLPGQIDLLEDYNET